MALGQYPIPMPTHEEIDYLFQIDPHGLSPRMEAKNGPQSQMPIFELLECIVNQPAPTLPKTHFSEEFIDFINRCLKKETSERSDLKMLLVIFFYVFKSC